MSQKTEKLNRLLDLLGDTSPGGGSFRDVCNALTIRKNKEHALAFSKAPFGRRLLIVPQCLRATGACRAEERGEAYVCARCGACKIGTLAERAADLGYLGTYILKGGSAVARLVAQAAPAAVVGLACHLEGALGVLTCEEKGVAVQFVPLARDGCADTDVDLDEALDVLEFRQP